MVHVHLCAQIRWLALLANVSTNLIQIQVVKISALMNLQTVNIIPSVQLIRMKMDVLCLKHVLELSLLLKKAMAQLLLFGVSTIFILFFDILFFNFFLGAGNHTEFLEKCNQHYGTSDCQDKWDFEKCKDKIWENYNMDIKGSKKGCGKPNVRKQCQFTCGECVVKS